MITIMAAPKKVTFLKKHFTFILLMTENEVSAKIIMENINSLSFVSLQKNTCMIIMYIHICGLNFSISSMLAI